MLNYCVERNDCRSAHIIALGRCQREIPSDLTKRICIGYTTARIIAAAETSPVCLVCAKNIASVILHRDNSQTSSSEEKRERERERSSRKPFAICFTQLLSRTLPTSPQAKQIIFREYYTSILEMYITSRVVPQY